MQKKFIKFIPLFLNRDTSFNLLEKSSIISFYSKQLSNFTEGLAFYSLLYNQPIFSLAQLGLYQKIISISKKSFPINEFKIIHNRYSYKFWEDNFFKNDITLKSKILESDFSFFKNNNINEFFEIMINPIIKVKSKETFLNSESSINCFFLNAKIKRYKSIIIEYENSSYDLQNITLEGENSLIFQNVYDYLNGITILNPSRNIGNIYTSPFCEKYLPEFTNLLTKTSKDIKEYVNDPYNSLIINQEIIKDEFFLDKEFNLDFDNLLECLVNEFENKKILNNF